MTSLNNSWPTQLQWHSTDNIKPKASQQFAEKNINFKDIAFLQYTSGSTGDPKGVNKFILFFNMIFYIYSIFFFF